MSMEIELDRLFAQAEAGRRYWNFIDQEKYDFVLLLPDEDAEVNRLMKKAFEEMLVLNKSTGKILSILDKTISYEDARCLIQFYSMYRFTDKLIIGSLVQPYGRKIENLLILEGVNLETLIRATLFGLGEKVHEN